MICNIKIPLQDDELLFVVTELDYTPEQKQTFNCEFLPENVEAVDGYVLGTHESFEDVYDFFMGEVTDALLMWYNKEEEG